MTVPFTIKLPPGVLEDGILRIDWTGFSHILNCQRDGWYFNSWKRILPGWEPGRGFGSAVHAAKDVRFKGWGSGPYNVLRPCLACGGEGSHEGVRCVVCKGKREVNCIEAMEEALARSFMEQVSCLDCEGRGILPYTDGVVCGTCHGRGTVERRIESHEGDHRTLGRAIEVLAEYDKLHPQESFDVLASELAGERELGVVEWELTRPVITDLPGNAIETRFIDDDMVRERRQCLVLWQYRIDRLIRDRDTGRVAVMDTKTTASASVQLDQVRNKFKMSPQFKLYAWTASALGYGEVLEAAVDHIIVRKPLLKPRPDSAPRNEFNRILLSWTAEQIEECRRDVLAMLGAWLTACGRWEQPPPMTGAPEQCHRYSTKPCPYLQVCEQVDERSRIGWLLGGNYMDNLWRAYEPVKETIP